VQYYFKPKDSDFRPYIGLGLIYSSFHKEKSLGILSGANFKLKFLNSPVLFLPLIQI
jgi:outer membrane protein W